MAFVTLTSKHRRLEKARKELVDLVNDQVCHLLYYLSFESPHGIYTGGSHSFSCRIRKPSKREDLVSATSSTSLVHTHLQLGCPRPSLPRHSQIPTTEPDQGTGMCPYSTGIEPFIYPTVSQIEKLVLLHPRLPSPVLSLRLLPTSATDSQSTCIDTSQTRHSTSFPI